MNTVKICNTIPFENIRVDGVIKPVASSNGISIKGFGETFVEALANSSTECNDKFMNLKLNIVGELDKKEITPDLINELKSMRVKEIKDGVYLLACADLTILRTCIEESDIEEFANTSTDLSVLLEALKLMRRGLKRRRVAIVNRVYVQENFRKCGISTWIHMNIFDLIQAFGVSKVSHVLLVAGDFSKEAKSKFDLTDEEYLNFLIEHYTSVGYSKIGKTSMLIKKKQDRERNA